MTKYMFPKEVLDSLSLVMVRSHIDMPGPGQPALGGPAWAGQMDEMTSTGPCQP